MPPNLADLLVIVCPNPQDWNYEWRALRGNVLVNGLVDGISGLPEHWEEATKGCQERQLGVSSFKLAWSRGDYGLAERTLEGLLTPPSSEVIANLNGRGELPESFVRNQYMEGQYSKWLAAQQFRIERLLSAGETEKARVYYGTVLENLEKFVYRFDQLRMQMLAVRFGDAETARKLDPAIIQDAELLQARANTVKESDPQAARRDFLRASELVEQRVIKYGKSGYDRGSDPDNFLTAARLAHSAGDLTRATRLYSQCTEPFEFLEAGLLFEKEGILEQAQDFFRQAVSRRGGSYINHLNIYPGSIGHAYVGLGMKDEAQEVLERGIKSAQNRDHVGSDLTVEAFAVLGGLAEKLGRAETAISLYQEAFKVVEESDVLASASSGLFATGGATSYSNKWPYQVAQTIANLAAKLGREQTAETYGLVGKFLARGLS